MQISTGIHRTCMIYKTCPQTCPFLELATNDFDAHIHSSIKLLKKGRGEHITQHLLFARQVDPPANLFKKSNDFFCQNLQKITTGGNISVDLASKEKKKCVNGRPLAQLGLIKKIACTIMLN